MKLDEIKNLHIDDVIAKYFVDNFGLFEYVHPNVITALGILCNYLIYKEIMKPNKNKLLLFVLFNLRTLTDILDGAVARKYKKSSKLGHVLDTLSDFINMWVLTNYLFKRFKLRKYHGAFFVAIVLFSEIKYEMFQTHEHFKKSEGWDSFYVNNTFIFNNLFYFILVHCL